ncbi:MAG: type IX secretion system membrane protein PorP/SprF [Bacteroidia bacterium]|nr:type IX secretion system membrane protein PorP/SprF [Bacteroidia bacterium]MCF8426992.1 type IX secretion system membrane protein PorP/SprF [Bacteroidia bacterium]MCF8445611.1 type IX secretion system membrane protein PorP/SprF [Bacteroidia bacterium]
MKKFATTFILFCVGMVTAFAQDPQLSQYYASPLYTNPAMAGASRKNRLSMNGRSQYTALNNNYKTAVVGFDAYLGKVKSGLGLVSMYDIAGDGFLTTTSISGIYSYNLEINRDWAFNAAIQGGIIQRRYDFSKFVFEDMIDPARGSVLPTAEAKGLEQITVPNFSTGFLLYNSRMFFGGAIHNIMEPNMSFYYRDKDDQALKLPRRYTVHGGVNLYLNKTRYEENRVILSPNILFMQQKEFYQMNLGFYVKQKSLTIGTWFRQTSNNADAAIFLIGMRFPSVKIGYSYDAIISKAKTATVGSHEISLSFELKPKAKQGVRYNKKLVCPEL